jgi:uncharacterized protein (TIGR02452 family)
MSIKEELSVKAIGHTEVMESNYKAEIQESIKNTLLYDFSYKQIPVISYKGTEEMRDAKIKVVSKTTTEAIFSESDGKTAVLNFASYKHPGGMFLEGSNAQEECLCHDSFLYNVLISFKDSYYNVNKKDNNQHLYRNKGLYSKNIRFFNHGDNCLCDVITCAAPNYRAARRYEHVAVDRNIVELGSRCLLVKQIAEIQKVDTLILGAFGCGVFGQDAELVSKLFYDIFKDCGTTLKKVVFAIPDEKSKNYLAFLNRFYGVERVSDLR